MLVVEGVMETGTLAQGGVLPGKDDMFLASKFMNADWFAG